MDNTNDKKEIDIINIFKNAAISFVNSFDKDLKYYFKENVTEDKITMIFELIYDRHLKYEFKMEKAKNNSDKIPNISGYEKLDNTEKNPYKELNFTDENYMLGNIYENIIKHPYQEIVCYKKIGIIVKNPINMNGIYNINIRYIGD